MPKSIKTGSEEGRERVSLRNDSGEEGRGGIIHILTSEGKDLKRSSTERRPGQKKERCNALNRHTAEKGSCDATL